MRPYSELDVKDKEWVDGLDVAPSIIALYMECQVERCENQAWYKGSILGKPMLMCLRCIQAEAAGGFGCQ